MNPNKDTDLPRIGKILVAVDESHHARRATSLATAMAMRFGAEITLLHILLTATPFTKLCGLAESYAIPAETLRRLTPLPQAIYEDNIGFPMNVMNPTMPTELLIELGRCILESHKETAERLGAADVTLVMEDGDPAERILEAAAREHSDLIVMGHRGLGALQGLLAGSVSTKVNQLAPVTVVAVK